MATTETGHHPNRMYVDQDGQIHLNGSSIYTDEVGTAVSATELAQAADAATAPVIVAAATTTLSVTATEHNNRLIVLNTNNATGITVTLPVATGSGARYEIVNNVAQTQGSIIVNCGTSIMSGIAKGFDSTAVTAQAEVFVATATDKVITFNKTTTGGLKGDRVYAVDYTANAYLVDVQTVASGNVATPFSAS